MFVVLKGVGKLALGRDVDVETEPVRSTVKPDKLSLSSGSSMNMKGAKTMLSKKH